MTAFAGLLTDAAIGLATDLASRFGGKERLVIGNDGSVNFTSDRYTTFVKIRQWGRS